jgi:phytoene synthase
LADDLEDLDEAVRRHDPDRWLASRFIADREERADVVALYAFNHELARVAGAVTNPIMGEIRLTWWSEALAEIFEGRAVRKHPVVLALSRAIARRGLDRDRLEAMVEARVPELDGAPVDVAATETPLIGLAAKVLGADVSKMPSKGAARDIPPKAFPAVAYLALGGHESDPPLVRRLRLTWAVLTGRL